MERGTCDDIRIILRAYGRERVCKALLQARDLNSRTISYFANYFGVPQRAFRAYRVQMCE